MNINNLKLLCGDKIELSNGVILKHPKLKDIKSIGEDVYGKFIRTFCAKPWDLVESLYKSDIDYESISDYELFNMLFINSYYEDIDFIMLFNMFFDVFYDSKEGVEKYKLIMPEENEGKVSYYLIDEFGNKDIVINEDNFEEIQYVIKSLTGYTNKEAPKFNDNFVKNMLIEHNILIAELDRKNRKNNSFITMSDLIGAVVLDTSYTFENVWDMYIYQFHSCTRMILKREDYKNTMTGIYSGSLDPKKINMEKIYWLTN